VFFLPLPFTFICHFLYVLQSEPSLYLSGFRDIRFTHTHTPKNNNTNSIDEQVKLVPSYSARASDDASKIQMKAADISCWIGRSTPPSARMFLTRPVTLACRRRRRTARRRPSSPIDHLPNEVHALIIAAGGVPTPAGCRASTGTEAQTARSIRRSTGAADSVPIGSS